MSKPNPNPQDGRVYDAETHQWVEVEVPAEPVQPSAESAEVAEE